MIKIYNTLTKKKEHINKKNIITIYTCGITVYDYCHIGHARIFLLFDSLIRYLNSLNTKIIFIRNITDIDDKIIKRAHKKHTTTEKLTRFFTKKMHNDTKHLNIIEPTYEPKATTFIPEMVKLITDLKKKKYAYKNKKSDIYFNINNFNKYGQLSNQHIKNLKESYNKLKNRQNNDFVLWKKKKKTESIHWPTDLGNGRPGWHTECAAMIMYYSKENIDIHGGGQDLLFPHHENELAQCEAILNKNHIKIWMHIGQIKINKKKMSKNTGNFILIKDFLKNFNEEYLRFLILSTNYKKSIHYEQNTFNKIKKTLDKLYSIKTELKEKKHQINGNVTTLFHAALKDNFNTQKAISILFKSINNDRKNNSTKYTVIELFKTLGLLKHTTLKKPTTIFTDNITNLITMRNLARKEKNWIIADKIRKKLNDMNIKISDEKSTITSDII